jgi:hypothetical protein
MPTYASRLAFTLTIAAVGCVRATTGTTTATTTTTTATTTTASTNVTTSTTQPQTTATASALPAGRAVIDRYVQAIGGRDAVMRHSSIRYLGAFEVPAAGLKGALTVVQVSPNKMAMTADLPGMGQMVSGYNGTVGWSINPMQGPRVLEGKELEQLREDAGPSALLRPADRIRSAETVELTSMNGKPCYKVKITSNSGRETFDCYSTETGLLVGMTGTQESPMGSVSVTTFFDDWKEFGGLKTATKMRQQMLGQEQILTIDRLEFDRPEDVKAVEVPEQIKPLVKKP